MADEQGNKYPDSGQYLEVVPNKRLVFTDAFVGDWQPSEKPFLTATPLFEDASDGKTRYTAVARHWTVEDTENHKKMGFHEGWGICARQLEALAASLDGRALRRPAKATAVLCKRFLGWMIPNPATSCPASGR
jgi:uncharacterized protein YndB with AHSA1/START domain